MNLLIIFGVIIVIWIFLEMKGLQHKILALFLILLVLFAYLGTSSAFAEQEIDFTSVKGITTATKLYFSWLFSVGKNIKTLTINAIKMDWMPEKNITENNEKT